MGVFVCGCPDLLTGSAAHFAAMLKELEDRGLLGRGSGAGTVLLGPIGGAIAGWSEDSEESFVHPYDDKCAELRLNGPLPTEEAVFAAWAEAVRAHLARDPVYLLSLACTAAQDAVREELDKRLGN